jgi:hypothetical protein
MALKYVLEAMAVLDDPRAGGAAAQELFARYDWREVVVKRVEGPKGSTDFVKLVFPGTRGKRSGGDAPTTGIVGRLGGLGSRRSLAEIVG